MTGRELLRRAGAAYEAVLNRVHPVALLLLGGPLVIALAVGAELGLSVLIGMIP